MAYYARSGHFTTFLHIIVNARCYEWISKETEGSLCHFPDTLYYFSFPFCRVSKVVKNERNYLISHEQYNARYILYATRNNTVVSWPIRSPSDGIFSRAHHQDVVKTDCAGNLHYFFLFFLLFLKIWKFQRAIGVRANAAITRRRRSAAAHPTRDWWPTSIRVCYKRAAGKKQTSTYYGSVVRKSPPQERFAHDRVRRRPHTAVWRRRQIPRAHRTPRVARGREGQEEKKKRATCVQRSPHTTDGHTITRVSASVIWISASRGTAEQYARRRYLSQRTHTSVLHIIRVF